MPSYDVSLWDFLRYIKKQEHQDFFPISERIEMTRRICEGLIHINKRKVAHRDVKLGNVFKISNLFFL